MMPKITWLRHAVCIEVVQFRGWLLTFGQGKPPILFDTFILCVGFYQMADSKLVDGGRCMRGIDGKLCFSEQESGKVWKDYVKGTMNEENDWDHNVERDAVEGSVVCASRGVVQVEE